MKKILLSCVTCLLAVGLLAGCDDEVEEVTPDDPNAGVVEPSGDDSGTGGGSSDTKEIVFGFSVDGVMNYMDGGTVSGYAYEGTLTTDVAEASKITLEESGTKGAYYLSFDNGGTTNWITIIDNSGHTNLSYATEKALLYYNAEYECWGNADMDYFLCYNSTYKCLYATAIGDTRYGLETSTPSPIAALYYTDGSAVTGLVGYELVAPTTLTVSGATEVYVGSSITLTVTTEAGADKSVTWSWEPAESSEGVVTVEGGKVTGVTAGEVVVTATSAVAPSVSDSITITVLNIPDVFPYEIGEDYFLGYDRSGTYYYFNGDAYGTGNQAYYGGMTTDTDEAAKVVIEEVEGGYALKCNDKYLYMEPNDSYHNFKWDGTEAKAWDYDYANDLFTTTDSDGDVYYMGTSGTYNEVTMNAITDINSNIPARLIEPSAPTEITITASKDSVSVNGTLQLTLTYQGAGALKGVTWSSSDDNYATVSDDGLVTGVMEAEKVTITATSTVDNTIEGSIDLAVTEEIQGLIGTLDFSVITDKNGSQIKETTALDSCWVGASDIYTGLSDIDSTNHPVYTGSGNGGAFPSTAGLIRFGKSGNGGIITFNFKESTGIKSAVISAHSYYVSTDGSYKADDTLYVNNTGLTLSSSGTPADVIWTDETGVDALTLSTVDSSSSRAYVFSITLYSIVLGN